MKMDMDIRKKIKEIIENSDLEIFGVRADNYKYSIGDDAHVSHQLFQDPEWDEYGNLLYPKGEGFYKDFYDAGELDGTCVIEIDVDYDSDEKISRKINALSKYGGKHFYLIGGKKSSCGNDEDEIIIENAKVIAFLDEV